MTINHGDHPSDAKKPSVPEYKEQGQGPIIILVPGLDGTALLFYRQIPLLSEHFDVLTFSLPNDSNCTMDSLIEDLRRLIDDVLKKREDKRVLLCGESFGGALSLSFALAHPELPVGLVIVNSFPTIRQRLQLRMALYLLRMIPWGAMRLVRKFTESRLHSPHALPEDLYQFHLRMRSVGRKGYLRRLEILQSYDIREKLHRIQTPTLFLAGDLDRLVPSVQEARFMSERMPNASMVELKGYGHICLINHDLNLLDYIWTWLRR
jgi:pimeloyl-ACP methyl ester carboxylesterase